MSSEVPTGGPGLPTLPINPGRPSRPYEGPLYPVIRNAFEGKPRYQDTFEAIQRLRHSRNPVLRELGKELGHDLSPTRTPLSTGNPTYRREIGQAIRQATLELVKEGYAVGKTRSAIAAELSSHTAGQGKIFNKPPGTLTPQQAAKRTAFLAKYAGETPPTMPTAFPLAQRAQPGFIPSLRAELEHLPEIGVGLQLSRDLPLSPENLATQAGNIAQQVVQIPQNLGQRAGQQLVKSFRNLFKPQPGTMPSPTPTGPGPQPSFQPEPSPIQPNPQRVPTLDQRPCAACDRLQRQRGELEKSIETEQSQELDKEYREQEQQIQQFQQQEQQDIQSRDIQSELRQKQALLSQINQEIANARNQQATQQGTQTEPQTRQPGMQTGTQPSETVPTLQEEPGRAQSLDEQAAQQLEQRAQSESQLEPAGAIPAGAIRFCVGCQSNEDAILFLNGEPSACSVIPGTTMPMKVGN